MERIVLFSLIALCGLFCCGIQKTPDILDGRILWLGDSITEDGRYVSIVEYELFKHFPEADIDLVSIGLSSETVSGLTEPDHPYPRPNVLERLPRALKALKPKTVFACYGMNDGIYYPQSDERMQAFQSGINRFITAVRQSGARLILITPPVFDAAAIPQKLAGPDAGQYGYSFPYAGYDDVLGDYATWLLGLKHKDVRVLDLHGAMSFYLKSKRQTDPSFTLSQDGVHPGLAGHAFMAQQVLKGLDVPMIGLDPIEYAVHLDKDSLFHRVQRRRAMRSMAWLLEIGFNKPGDYKGLPVDQAEVRAQTEKVKIKSQIGLTH
jgi:lysophospholipase L1-like esterase